MARFLFPRSANRVLPILVFGVMGPLVTASAAGVWYYGTNKHTQVGYAPVQPVDFSHKLHAGELGMDCRYCHFTVEQSAFAAVPPTQVCMNCHAKVKTDSVKLLPVQESAQTGQPIPWVRVHNLPDYVFFDHGAHLSAGVGCSTCHGRIDQMDRVRQDQPLSMSWCLDCHRDPGTAIRKPGTLTQMTWRPDAVAAHGPRGAVSLLTGRNANPPTHCSGCHR
ncbi:cytochrome c3 family protein [Myxococcus faecalis]|uniref:cytochrome c3 family protein n=1 Tax=Myxococcus faecalis TaxID=3115646 RepID=UPI003CF82159